MESHFLQVKRKRRRTIHTGVPGRAFEGGCGQTCKKVLLSSLLLFAAMLAACGANEGEEGSMDDAVNEGTAENGTDRTGEENGTDSADEDTAENTVEEGFGGLAQEADAVAEVADTEGQQVGTVLFYAHEGKVVIDASMSGLEPGWHGFHIHETAECDPDAGDGPFTSAGGHYNPYDRDHAHHQGDMPPLFAMEDGMAHMNVTMDRFTPEQLLQDEVAVIVHADRDNFGHIPDRYQSADADEPGPDEATLNTGDAGARIACGVVQPGGGT
jgi:superoxide dismutase, Cu-Zn family